MQITNILNNGIKLHYECAEDNPYVTDKIYIEDGDSILLALTRKNADFIEAVIGLDSNYNWDGDKSRSPSK